MNTQELFTNKDDVIVVRKSLIKILDDINEAIVLNQLNYWLEINRKANKNFRDGRYWAYGTYAQWQERDFEFWSIDTIKRAFTRLEKKKIVVSKYLNSNGYDKTKWYTIDYDLLDKMASSPVNNAISANCPDDKGKMPCSIQETKERDYCKGEDTKDNLNIINPKGYIYASTSTEIACKGGIAIAEKSYTDTQLKNTVISSLKDYFLNELNYRLPDYETIGDVVQLTLYFYKKYHEHTGMYHRILSDKAYWKICGNYMMELKNADVYDNDEMPMIYGRMIDLYFKTDFDGKHKKYNTVNKSLSHFMTVRTNLLRRVEGQIDNENDAETFNMS